MKNRSFWWADSFHSRNSGSFHLAASLCSTHNFSSHCGKQHGWSEWRCLWDSPGYSAQQFHPHSTTHKSDTSSHFTQTRKTEKCSWHVCQEKSMSLVRIYWNLPHWESCFFILIWLKNITFVTFLPPIGSTFPAKY